MVDKMSGQVAYAVMSFGGFLGIGDSYHPLPWKSLTYYTNMGGSSSTSTGRELEGAPSYKATRIRGLMETMVARSTTTMAWRTLTD